VRLSRLPFALPFGIRARHTNRIAHRHSSSDATQNGKSRRPDSRHRARAVGKSHHDSQDRDLTRAYSQNFPGSSVFTNSAVKSCSYTRTTGFLYLRVFTHSRFFTRFFVFFFFSQADLSRDDIERELRSNQPVVHNSAFRRLQSVFLDVQLRDRGDATNFLKIKTKKSQGDVFCLVTRLIRPHKL